MIKCNKLFVSESHCYHLKMRGYDILVHLDSVYGNWIRIDKPYNEKTLYCTPYEQETLLDIPQNPSQMVLVVSNILDNYLKSKL